MNTETLSGAEAAAPLPERKAPQPWLVQVKRALAVAALAFASYFLISHLILQSVQVVGRSMVPTLRDSENYLLNRWVYHLRNPRPNDIVVLRDPLDQGFSVKRIVAGSGDTIYLTGGSVYVNGRKLQETYLPAGTPTFACPPLKDQLFRCGPNQYFVLGDNRENSVDSRAYGPVPRGNILGLVVR